MTKKIPPGHVGITDPPAQPLHEQMTCLEHGPTVRVLWTSGLLCPLCESHGNEQRMRDRHRRYSIGIKGAIGDDRITRDNGEPERSDANEIRALKNILAEERKTLREYEDLLEEFGYEFGVEDDDHIEWLRKLMCKETNS